MNGVDPYHDIAGIQVKDTNEEIDHSTETNNLTIIGESEINRLSVADANGVISVP